MTPILTPRAADARVECKAGRLLVNGFPTGMESAERDGPWRAPISASNHFAATSVQHDGNPRFLRPVCYQTMPDALLPEDLWNQIPFCSS